MTSQLRSLANCRGTTVVEALVALGIIAVLVVTMASLLAMGREVTVSTRRDTLALALARARLEQLTGLTFSVHALASGGSVEVTDLVTDLSGEAPRIGGRGLSTSPGDALLEAHAGYVDYLDGDGSWAGTNASVAGRAAYTRRWTIRRLGAGSSEIVAFEVMVAPVSVVSRVSGPNLLRQPGVVRLVGIRARKAV